MARLIVFEGPDGSGKSTALQGVAAAMRARGQNPLCTREPGGNEIAEHIRRALLAPCMHAAPHSSQLLLLYAARVAHLRLTIEPALRAGREVLCDRYIDSSFVYQVHLGDVAGEFLDSLQAQLDIPDPDLRLFFELPATVAMRRLTGRAESNRFDAQDSERWLAVMAAYKAQAARHRDTVRWINANQTADAVVAECLEMIDSDA